MKESGSLYIIASSIGNPEDMTLRAMRILKEDIDIIYCEDTRQTRWLLNYHGINMPLKSLHTHSDSRKIESLIKDVQSGLDVAYMTDSGTPGLSDPGSRVVADARDAGIEVIPVPGVSALTTIVSVSGFPDKNIIFGGFLSKKPGKRKNEMARLMELEGIIVIYESPHRIKKTLADVSEVFAGRKIFIGREMTKKFEEYISIEADDIPDFLEELTDKGEFAIAILNKTLKKNKYED